MRKIFTSALIGTALLASGCATQTATISPSSSSTIGYQESEKFYISGIGQEKVVDVAEVCGSASNVSSVASELRPIDIALGIVTLGIYTPRTATVYCK